MTNFKASIFNLKTADAKRLVLPALLFAILTAAFYAPGRNAAAQIAPSANRFRVGERLTYNISLGKFANAGYAELYAVSQGKIGDRTAVELRSKIKTSELVSAAFYLIDNSRVTFAAADSGLPLYVKKTISVGVSPKEIINNYLVAPTVNYDLLTLIYQIRTGGGGGTYILQEDERSFSVSVTAAGAEKIKNDAGEFETSIFTVQSEYFTELGVTEVKINLSSDDAKIPVLFRLKTAKGDFKLNLASVQEIVENKETPAPIAAPVAPRPAVTPTPVPTPTPYQDNQPLLAELPFDLGETLDYQLSSNNQPAGTLRLQAAERKQFSGQDSLLLTATATGTGAGANRVFNPNDSITAHVNPDTLAPQQIEIKLSGPLGFLNQTTQFDQRTGAINLNGTKKIDAPVGTHSLLSLIYAIRSFNLKPSKDAANPVNDTRVAVFWDSQAYIFTLRPATADIINLRGEKTSAQLISVNTGNPQLDQLSLRLWLSNDDKRLPLRIAVGSYQADLVSETQIKLK